MMRLAAMLAVVAALAACEKKAASAPSSSAPAPTPAAAPAEPGYAGVPEAPAAASVVEAPAQVNTDTANAENQLVKTEVLARIDSMPNLKPEEKDKLYVQVERARGMGRIVTIPFPSGKTVMGPAEIAALTDKLKLPQIQTFSEDPTVVFVVLGFADKKGDPAGNQAISLQRAESAVKALKNAGIVNLVQAVGMGSSEMFDAKNLDKNRVVEVWAVLP